MSQSITPQASSSSGLMMHLLAPSHCLQVPHDMPSGGNWQPHWPLQMPPHLPLGSLALSMQSWLGSVFAGARADRMDDAVARAGGGAAGLARRGINTVCLTIARARAVALTAVVAKVGSGRGQRAGARRVLARQTGCTARVVAARAVDAVVGAALAAQDAGRPVG